MHKLQSRIRRLTRYYMGNTLFILLFLLGIVLIGLAATLPERFDLLHEILRDIGISLLIATVVGTIYDIHARSRFDIETMSGVLGAIMGDFVSGEVWAEIKERILSKSWIRDPMSLDITLKELDGPDAPVGMVLLHFQMDYRLRNLKSIRQVVPVSHRLDSHRSHGVLPRFTYIRIGSDILDMSNLTSGSFDHKVLLEPASTNKTVRVRVDREELVYLPGSYNLVLTSVAKGLKISLRDAPENVRCFINLRPNFDEPIPINIGDSVQEELEDFLLLPGQVIEFIFAWIRPEEGRMNLHGRLELDRIQRSNESFLVVQKGQ